MAFREIEALRARRTMGIIEPEKQESSNAPMAIEPNISHVLADQVWAMGYRGEGMVVANIDTGVRYTHETLVAPVSRHGYRQPRLQLVGGRKR